MKLPSFLVHTSVFFETCLRDKQTGRYRRARHY